VRIGAQDLSECGYGAHTGEVGAELLGEFGCALVLVGHSERRQAGECDDIVAAKAVAADRAGLIPLLCVGESEAEREAGETTRVIERQLAAVTAALAADRPLWLAYEPVWAIGTGRNATPAQAGSAHRALRAALTRACRDAEETPILYGGSVKPASAAELLAVEGIDGALVGGASLEAEAFLGIVDAAISARSRKMRS
jgi:triosephosphate isomerase